MLGGDTTQTGTPWRPRLRAIESPLRFPPTTNAPVVLFMNGNSLEAQSARRTEFGCSLVLGARKLQFGRERCSGFVTVARRPVRDELHGRTRRVVGGADELHQGAEAP